MGAVRLLNLDKFGNFLYWSDSFFFNKIFFFLVYFKIFIKYIFVWSFDDYLFSFIFYFKRRQLFYSSLGVQKKFVKNREFSLGSLFVLKYGTFLLFFQNFLIRTQLLGSSYVNSLNNLNFLFLFKKTPSSFLNYNFLF